MDELRGPNIQIILHVKEGLGFGFLKTPFIVSGSLNGYMLETDPVVPCHAPIFDAELVWEADKRRFRSLRVQNVPIKVEVFTMGTAGRKDKVGYLLLSLLGAQPCPSNKFVDIKHSWHRLLGVKSEGKCCHPQLMLSLTVEDRVNTLTPRNELRLFHSNEVAYLQNSTTNPPTARSMLLTLNEYIAESKKTASSPELRPKLLCDEGLIQIGDGNQLFVLSFVIGAVKNLDLLLPERNSNEVDFYVSYSVFTHDVMTDRVNASDCGNGMAAQFDQRTSLRLRTSLATLSSYFAECPLLVTRICAGDRDVGICSMDLRKLIPTADIEQFVKAFCNENKTLTIHERCFILRCDEFPASRADRRPYVDVEMSLKYVGVKQEIVQKPKVLTARSATQLENGRKSEPIRGETALDYKSGSCTNIDRDVGGVAYTNMAVSNTARYRNASGDAVLQTNEIAELIKKMCDSFAQSQEKLLAARFKPTTSDMQIQCDGKDAREEICGDGEKDRDRDKYDAPVKEIQKENVDSPLLPATRPLLDMGLSQMRGFAIPSTLGKRGEYGEIPEKLESSKSETFNVQNEKDSAKRFLSAMDRDSLMRKFVEELEDWKERQQELFKCQLKRKEDYHLELLAKEWEKRRVELECKLSKGIEQCRNLASDLSRATEDFRLRGYRNSEREKKLLEAKKALEAHYTAKYQELREASQKMEDDMNHQLKLKDMRIEELEMKVLQLEKQVNVLKINLKNNEKETENKYSGLTKDQTASLIQELRCLEEKLDSAVQSKAFFKEQWGRAVRELHLLKLRGRRQMLTQLQQDRHEMGLDTVPDDELKQSTVDINRLKDDFYVDILANTPALEASSIISISGPDGMEMYEDLKSGAKNPMNDKLTDLIAQRDLLIQRDNPDEEVLKQLNHEIRNLLLNCGT